MKNIIESLELKNYRMATNEEIETYAKLIHPNNEKWANDFAKKYYFIVTKDNYILAIETEKNISIMKDLWFDDELPIPQKTKKLFIEYNNRSKKARIEYFQESNTILFLQRNYCINNKNACVCPCRLRDEIRQEYYYRDLTEEERKEYIEILQAINKAYVERLEKYYKKYADKIYCMGYWVNR